MAIIEPGKPIPVWIYGAGAAGLFIAYTLYSRSRKKSAAATPTPKAATTATSTPVVAASSYGNNQNAGAISNIEQQLQRLNASQATTQGAAASSGVNGIMATAENQVQSGSGYYPKPDAAGPRSQRINANGSTYVWVPNEAAAGALGGFNNLYVQPVPGLFTKNTPGTVLNNSNGPTPLFAKVS